MSSLRTVVHTSFETKQVRKMQKPILAYSFYEAPPIGSGFIYLVVSPSGKGYVGQTIRSVYKRN